MDLNHYFDVVKVDNIKRDYLSHKNQLIAEVTLNQEIGSIKSIGDFDVAIIGVAVNGQQENDQLNGLKNVRSNLYSLSNLDRSIKIIDLGNLKNGKTYNDTIIGLRDVIVELITSNVLPILIGSSDIILYANYLAYKTIGEKINIVSIDNKINITNNVEDDYKSPLWRILVEENDALFTYTNIGYQSHYASTNITKYLTDHLHNAYRLGHVKTNLKDVEPVLRDAQLIGLNISSVKQSEAFGQLYASPNGFYGDEICQLARYSGISDKVSSFGVYDYYPLHDINSQTASLISQIVWYFLSGFIYRSFEHPIDENKNFKKFIVNLDTLEYELVFYKSEKTDKWWMEVPSFKNKSEKKLLISCNYNDYNNSCNGEVPERWVKVFQKIN